MNFVNPLDRTTHATYIHGQEVAEMKSPQMQRVVDAIAKEFGWDGNPLHCRFCNSLVRGPEDFKDEISRLEWDISGLCQSCQDEAFKEPDDE